MFSFSPFWYYGNYAKKNNNIIYILLLNNYLTIMMFTHTNKAHRTAQSFKKHAYAQTEESAHINIITLISNVLINKKNNKNRMVKKEDRLI